MTNQLNSSIPASEWHLTHSCSEASAPPLSLYEGSSSGLSPAASEVPRNMSVREVQQESDHRAAAESLSHLPPPPPYTDESDPPGYEEIDLTDLNEPARDISYMRERPPGYSVNVAESQPGYEEIDLTDVSEPARDISYMRERPPRYRRHEPTRGERFGQAAGFLTVTAAMSTGIYYYNQWTDTTSSHDVRVAYIDSSSCDVHDTDSVAVIPGVFLTALVLILQASLVGFAVKKLADR